MLETKYKSLEIKRIFQLAPIKYELISFLLLQDKDKLFD